MHDFAFTFVFLLLFVLIVGAILFGITFTTGVYSFAIWAILICAIIMALKDPLDKEK